MLKSLMKWSWAWGFPLAALIFSIAFALFAISGSEVKVTGCYHVVDVAGKDWYFVDQPNFDLNVRAIALETDGSTGWIWPASVEVDLACTGNLDGA